MAGCGKCQQHRLGAIAPGEAGPMPLWAKMLIAFGLVGTAVVTAVAIKQAR